MVHGAILPGEQQSSKEHWAEDILGECYFYDHLWGYIICVAEELYTHNPMVFTNRVLFNLMRMGAIDWGNKNTQNTKVPRQCIWQLPWLANIV